jgi:hypothetical protein
MPQEITLNNSTQSTSEPELESFVSVGMSGAVTVDIVRYLQSKLGQEMLDRLECIDLSHEQGA